MSLRNGFLLYIKLNWHLNTVFSQFYEISRCNWRNSNIVHWMPATVIPALVHLFFAFFHRSVYFVLSLSWRSRLKSDIRFDGRGNGKRQQIRFRFYSLVHCVCQCVHHKMFCFIAEMPKSKKSTDLEDVIRWKREQNIDSFRCENLIKYLLQVPHCCQIVCKPPQRPTVHT